MIPRVTTKHEPAAGTKWGKKPYDATVWTPDFLRLDEVELHTLFQVLRDPLTTQVYMLLVIHSDFVTGEFLGSYAQFIKLCTPPPPERGKPLPEPSYKQIRRCVDDLIKYGLLTRDAEANKAHGQLRLKLMPRKKPVTPS